MISRYIYLLLVVIFLVLVLLLVLRVRRFLTGVQQTVTDYLDEIRRSVYRAVSGRLLKLVFAGCVLLTLAGVATYVSSRLRGWHIPQDLIHADSRYIQPLVVTIVLLLAPVLVLGVGWLIGRLGVHKIREYLDRPRGGVFWVLSAGYAVLVITAVAAFYFSSTVQVWRIRRDLMRAGITQPISIEISGGDAILTGQIATRKLSITVSRRVGEMLGPGHVTNRLRVEEPLILGSYSEQLGEAQVTVDTAYDDSPQSLEKIKAVLDLPLFEVIGVRRGWTMIHLIRSRYGIGSSKLPKSFAMLADKIGRLNDLSAPEGHRPFSLKIPILPARHAAPVSGRGHIGFVDFVSSGLSDSLERVVIRRSLRPIRSSLVLLNIPFTRGAAGQTQRIAAPLSFSLLRSRMTIEFGDDGGGSASNQGLIDAEKNAILKALKQKHQRDATVFILDSGWPSEEDYASSLKELRGLVDNARDFYGLPESQYAMKRETPIDFSALDPPDQHCIDIKQALEEFTDLDTTHVVKIVYVPLSLKQHSYQILNELLTFYQMTTVFHHNRSVPADIKAASWKTATEAATRTLNNLAKGPDMPDPTALGLANWSYQGTWQTDSSIALAVWYLADLASYRNPQHPVYFLNESWTVLPDAVQLDPPDRSYGIVVAAVGNDPAVEVNREPGRAFAKLAKPATNVLAALDATRDVDQPACDSSKVIEDELDNTMAAAFDGNATKAGPCGSSFSAPRIAWLLALSEEIRTGDQDIGGWAGSVQQKLKALRPQGSMLQWKRLYLHPTSLFP